MLIKIPKFSFLFLVSIFFLFPFFSLASPGGMDANGCHVCRTNCEKYNVPYSVLHCHLKVGTTTQIIISPPVAPTKSSVPAPAPVAKPQIKKSEIATTSVKIEVSDAETNQTAQVPDTQFFTKKSTLWFAFASGIGLLAGLGFVASTKKP